MFIGYKLLRKAMKPFVKLISIPLFLMLVYSLSIQGAGIENRDNPFSCILCSFHSLDENQDVDGNEHFFYLTDVELNLLFSFRTTRSALRIHEDTQASTFLKGVIAQLSNRVETIALRKTKKYNSNHLLFTASNSCDYYVFALRQLLI